MIEITYITEPVKEYARKIRSAESLDELRDVVEEYLPLTEDAVKRVSELSDNDFVQFKREIKRAEKITKNNEATRFNKTWGDIVMPRLMLNVSLYAVGLGVPFGTAYIRLKEEKML